MLFRKWTVVILCCLQGFLITLTTNAQSTFPLLTEKVDFTGKQVRIITIMESLQKQTGYTFSYEKAAIDDLMLPEINFNQTQLGKALEFLQKNTAVKFQVYNKNIGVSRARAGETKPAVKKDPGKISGKVLDEENGQPVAGATIRIGEKGTTTGLDGAFILQLSKGNYTASVSYVGYDTKEIEGITVKDNETFQLNLTLKRNKGRLASVTVKASAKKESVNALLVRQKNAAEVSNGISAEQIARTPDKNIGESLKRISGVSSVDNKFILVRGIGERYNTALLDGTVLPSTEAQTRNFSFDMIPSNLVDNVIVSKTVTPDMNASFGGGLIQINTKDIPSENFMSVSAGISVNDQTTGKDFLAHERGKYDYLGFDDGRRKFPKELTYTDRTVLQNMSDEDYAKLVETQSRKFTKDNFTVYKTKAVPSQNYQFTIGRVFHFDSSGNKKFGFTGSISYRNTQQINLIDQQRRTDWYGEYNNGGASYGFNTIWGGLLNAGLQLGKSRFTLRNTFTHMFDNTLVRTIGYNDDLGAEYLGTGIPPNKIEDADDPTFTDLLQNKLTAQHQLGKVKIEWTMARTAISRQEKDLSILTQYPVLIGKDYEYFPGFVSSTEPRMTPTSRQHYQNKETNYSWELAATMPFNIAGIASTVKAGYFGNSKHASFDWKIAALSADSRLLQDSMRFLSIKDMLKPENMAYTKYFYSVSTFFLDNYEGKSRNDAGYIVFDNRLLNKLRLVWGVRGEYYKYTELHNGNNDKQAIFNIKPDIRWQWLPSANLTYSPIKDINVRLAYSSSVVRPESMDNSQFWRYSPYLGAMYGNMGLYSSRINSYDLKFEWFPGAGEIISAAAFYKKFDKPAELTFSIATGNVNYYLKSADWANVYGLEFEMRKNLGFISNNNKLLNNLIAYGNLTLQKSTVRSTYTASNPNGGADLELSSKQKRPMYGQTPYLINGGLMYNDGRIGINVVYNKQGYKTYIVSENLDNIEYEKPREQLDAQISYRFLNKKLELKLNFGNLLNSASVFFVNSASYEVNPDHVPSSDYSNAKRLKPGFTDKYEDGDEIRFRQYFGRTFGATISYNF